MRPAATLSDMRNAFDFLQNNALAYWTQVPIERDGRISWPSRLDASASFLGDLSQEASVGQYLAWLQAREYACLLPDGGMLQITYDFEGQSLVGHRLVYLPCPVQIDDQMLAADVDLPDLVALEVETAPRERFLQRSPIRFDFDPSAATLTHPASHMTINANTCRIFCVAPMHPYSFISFVYRNFYPMLHDTQLMWFSKAAERRVKRTKFEQVPNHIHVAWRKL